MRRIVLFNLDVGGHFPQHLHCLTSYWEAHRPKGELHVVVSDVYVRMHPDSAASIDATPSTILHVAPLPHASGETAPSALARDRLHGRLLAQFGRSLRPEQIMLMCFDHAQFSIAAGLRFPWPLALSGIYFRPSFHYRDLSGPTESTGERIKGAAKRTVLWAALRNPHLRTLFSLDPFAVPRIAPWSRHTEVVALPEPLDLPHIEGDVELLHAVEAGRRRLIIFGTIDEKKGIAQVLDALRALPDEKQHKVALIVAGPLVESQRAALLTQIAQFDAETGVQVLTDDRYLPEELIQPLLAACDLVLLTYQRQHVGSSGVLVRAAAASVPVLATDYGVVGEQVRRHRLGITTDTARPEAIRAAVEAWLERPEEIDFDLETASSFAGVNTAAAFADTIFKRLVSPQRRNFNTIDE